MLTVYCSPTNLFSHVHFSLPPHVNWNSYLICNRAKFLWNFHFLMWLLLLMPHPLIWPFYFQGSGLPLLVSGSWSGSMCRAHITLQQLQAIAMMLHRMAFHISGKVVALYLDNSTAKASLIIKMVHCLLFFPGWPARY